MPGFIGGPLLCLVGIANPQVSNYWRIWTFILVASYTAAFYIVLPEVAGATDIQIARAAQSRAIKIFDFYGIIPVGSFALAYRSQPGIRTLRCFIFTLSHARTYSSIGSIGSLQYYTLCTLFAQTLVLMLKRGAARPRPCIRGLGLPLRVVPLSRFVDSAKYATESFPSGDSAQAMVFVATLLRVGYGRKWLVLVVASAAGRVFFHAHHVLDVVGKFSLSFLSN